MTQEEQAIEAAVQKLSAWWLIDDKRQAFKEALRRLIKRDLEQHKGRCDLYIDYDPQGTLLEAVRDAGVDCRGSWFSARGIFAAQKSGVEFRLGVPMVKQGYGCDYELLPANPEQACIASLLRFTREAKRKSKRRWQKEEAAREDDRKRKAFSSAISEMCDLAIAIRRHHGVPPQTVCSASPMQDCFNWIWDENDGTPLTFDPNAPIAASAYLCHRMTTRWDVVKGAPPGTGWYRLNERDRWRWWVRDRAGLHLDGAASRLLPRDLLHDSAEAMRPRS